MTKRLLLGLAVTAAIILAVISFLFRKNSSKEATVEPREMVEGRKKLEQMRTNGAASAVAETVVEFTTDGYSPKTITVKKGTTVKWVNKSKTPMWVASAPHPQHSDLPGFDQLTNSREYSYTFTKVSSWNYHNHAPLGLGGTVVVTD